MAIPATVLKVLDDWHIEYQFTDDQELFQLMQSNPPASYSARIANVVFLQDKQGKIQVVIPGNRLLDLTTLNRQLGRQLTALPSSELNELKARLGLDAFPALPQVTGITSLIDSHLLEQNELLIVAGADQQWLKLPQDQFRTLITGSQVGNYTAPLHTDIHYQNPLQDLDDVHAALRQFTPLRIKQRLSETLDLPPLPETARRIIELRVDPNADTSTLAHTIELDPGMAAQVMSWARSPYYGTRGDIKSIEEAVIRVLGFDLVINLALGLSLGRCLSVPKEGPHGYAPYWQQSVVTASLCAELVRQIPNRLRPSQGLAYLCGLLHNFGYLIMGHAFPPQFALVNRHIEANPHINRLYVERHLLGLTREQISACLLQQWRMPDELIAAIRQQHNAGYEGEHAAYARLLYIATRSLRRHGFGDGPAEQAEDFVLDTLGLTADRVDETTRDLLSRMDDLQTLVQLLTR